MCPGLILFTSTVPQFISLRSEVLLRSSTGTSIPCTNHLHLGYKLNSHNLEHKAFFVIFEVTMCLEQIS